MTKWIYKPFLVYLIFCSHVYGSETTVLIAYPETGGAQSQVYENVIKGIQKEIGDTTLLEVPGQLGDIQQQLDQSHPGKVIALGKRVAERVSKTSYQNKMLVGLAYFQKAEFNGVSLSIESRSLATVLRRLVPAIKRIFVVHQSGHQAIEVTSDPSNLIPTIISREGNDSLSTIRILGNLLEQGLSTSDAVFIPANITDDIRQEVERVAWDKKIMLLSTNFSHLETGIPLVFYPDPVALGEQLGRLANKKSPVYEATFSIIAGLNRRAAQHLDLEFSPQALDLFAVKIK